MKKNALALCMIMFVGLLMPFNTMGQNTNQGENVINLGIDGTALLGITTGASIDLSLGGAAQAGAAVQEQSADSTARLRISSLVSGATTRTINASIAPDMTATNTELTVMFGTPNGNFSNVANMGNLIASPVVLTTGGAQIVDGITTCWSGTGADDGYPIYYTFRRKADETAFSNPGAITVTYTLSAGN